MNQLTVEKKVFFELHWINNMFLFQNASLMSSHGLNKSQSCLICRTGWKIVILGIWGEE